ncbi:MAG: permease [Isosphaeraceae bacterium]
MIREVLALLRKQLIESKWMLGASAASFFGLSVLTVWLAWRFERLMAEGDFATNSRRFRPVQALGGPAMDFSTTALEVCWWNHPVIVLTLLSWAISRGANSIAGEIERGTIDVTLSRPVTRSGYLVSQVAFVLLGLLTLAGCLIAGNMAGHLFYTLKSPPTILTLAKPATMVVALGLAVFGCTVPFSACDVVRWRPTLFSTAILLAGLVSLSVAAQFPDYQWYLERLSVFQAYAPVTVAIEGEPLAYNTMVLLIVFGVGTALALILFARRDLPSNS